MLLLSGCWLIVMKIIRGLENIKNIKSPIVTLGNFDGVHLGHQKILQRVKAVSIKGNYPSAVITFDPHPIRVIAPEKGIRILTPFYIKAELIEQTGIDIMICIDFNNEFSSIEPDDFIRNVLVEKLSAVHVIVGHNYRFGKGKKGTTELIRRRGLKYKFKLNVVRNMKLQGGVVSSSRIRNLLLKGKVYDASLLIGRPYFIEGKVISGADRGKKILHTPTANLTTPNELVPKNGVYVVKVQLNGKIYDGVASIGTNPTFGKGSLSYEAHLFDFKGNLRGKKLRAYFIDRLRDEKQFPSHVELKNQIDIDINTAKEILTLKKRNRVNINI